MGNTVKTVFLLGLLSGLLLVIGELLGGQSGLLIATIILAPLSAMLIQAAISRSREFAADRGAAEIVGSRHGLADALRKTESVARRVPMHANPATAHMFIMKPISGRGVMALFSTHPPTAQRIERLLGSV